MIIGGVRTSDISDVDRICPMGGSNWLEFSWVRYIRWSSDIFIFGGVRALWNPTKGWIHPVGQIYPMGVGYVWQDLVATLLELMKTRHVRLVGYIRRGSDMSDRAWPLWYWNPTWALICLVHQICPTEPDCRGTGSRPGLWYVWCIRYVWPGVGYIRSGTNAKVLEPDGNIRPGQICSIRHRWRRKKWFGKIEHSDIFNDSSVVSLLIVRHTHDSK
jgi:hypothetical protein